MLTSYRSWSDSDVDEGNIDDLINMILHSSITTGLMGSAR